MAQVNNLSKFRARRDRSGPTPGHLVKIWDEKDRDSGEVTGESRLITLMGDTIGKKLSPGFELIDIVDPQGKMPLDGNLALQGSYKIPEGQKKPVLTVIDEDEQNWYCSLASGLILSEIQATDPKTGRIKRALSTEPDLIDLKRKGVVLHSHGFHSLGGARSVLAREAGIDFSGEESKRLWSAVGRDRLRGKEIPQYRYDLIAVPKNGGEGIQQDVDGTFVRLVGTPTELKMVDASGPSYRKFWDLAEEKRIEENAARREARRLAKQQPAPAESAGTPADQGPPPATKPAEGTRWGFGSKK